MTRFAVFAVFVLLAFGHASAADIPEAIHRDYLKGAASVQLPSDPTTIPLEGVGWYGHYRSPYLTVYVNGHGPYTFLFDTGASVTTISSKVAREASAQIVSHVPGHHVIVKLGEVRASGVSMRNYYAVVADGDDVDGILGFNSFGKNALTFDLQHRTLVVVFNDKTGATRTLVTSVDGRLALGPVYADRPAVAINEALPLPDIGVDVMDQFVTSFDRVHGRVAFQPLFAGTTFSVPGEFTYGVFISFRQARRSVRDVLPALAPARDGLVPGDPIVAIDGRVASTVSFRQWDEALRAHRPMSLVWTHAGQTRSATFPVVELR